MRVLKKYMNTSFFHIMSQGINKEYIFYSEEDKDKYMKIIEDTKEKIGTIILAYCIMDNHVHILFYEDKAEQLTKFMHKVNLLYAKYYNKKYDRVGYVFRGRYKTQPILTERYLYTCIRYIHNNPIKAKICEKPKEYKYSSYIKNRFYNGTEVEKNVRNFIYMDVLQEKDREGFVLLEVEQNKEELCQEIFKERINQNKIDSKDLKNNKELLKEIVRELKNDYQISFRIMEKIIGIGRETLRKTIQ